MSRTICGNGFVLLAAICLGMGTAARGGSLDDQAAPTDPASAMYTLQDLYNRLDTGAAGAKRAGPFAEPAAGPTAGTMHTYNEIMAKTPALNANAATAADVLSGKVFWGLKAGAWGQRSGTMATLILSGASAVVPAGAYAATNLTQVDPDLATSNIKAGTTIFGVAGKPEVVDTASGDAVAGDMLAGKKAYVAGLAVTGTIATATLAATTTVVNAGCYAATNLAQVATNLAAGNIAKDVGIFGITGTADVATGNATVDQVLAGNTFSTASANGLTGTMSNRGAVAFTPGTTPQTIPQGYHNGAGSVDGAADLVPGNIRSEINIFGVTGTPAVVDTTSGDAVAADILASKKAWVDGAEVTGTIATRTLSPANDTVASGNYAATNLAQVDTDLATANIKAGTTIFGVAGSSAVVDTTSGDAVAGDMLAGKKAYVAGLAVTGTIATLTLSDTTTNVAAGYYATTNLAQVDTDLTATNIRASVTLFGLAGNANVVDTGSGDATTNDVLIDKKAWVAGNLVTGTRHPSRVPKTGETNLFQAGDVTWWSTNNVGVAWPNPRFTVGTGVEATNCVTDNLTGLMWARNANLGGTKNWSNAIVFCEGLTYGGHSDWRLPNQQELFSLIDDSQSSPALCNTAGTGHFTENDPFTSVQANHYWSGTTYPNTPTYGKIVHLPNGGGGFDDKTTSQYMWPVCGGR